METTELRPREANKKSKAAFVFREINTDVQNLYLESLSSLHFNCARLDENFQYFITYFYESRMALQSYSGLLYC